MKRIIFVLAVILIMVTGCMQNVQKQQPTQQNTQTQQQNTPAPQAKSLPSCEVDYSTLYDAHYFPAFEKDNSPESCRKDCMDDACYTKYERYAAFKKDVQLCEKLDQPHESTRQASCFYGLSFFIFDREICSKISNAELKAACLMAVEGTTGLNDLDRSLYYAKNWFGKCSNDPTLSYEHDLEKPQAKTEKEKAECQKKVLDYLKENYKKECDDAFCDYFKGLNGISSCAEYPDYEEGCVTMFIYSGTGNECDSLPENQRDECISQVAVRDNDLDLCLTLSYDSCLKNIAVNTKNVEVCFETYDSFMSEMCVENYASELNDASVCSHSKYPGSKAFCEGLVD